jgi:protein-L-isoaspartate(D-aspartate) O-methyltransferase
MTTDPHQRLVGHLAGKGLLDNPRLCAAFQAVRREHFLPGVDLQRVYQDQSVTTHTEAGGVPVSSSSQPAVMAVMLGQLDPQPGDRVLEIGAGSGYNAALLAHLVAPGGQVVTIDIDPAVTAAASANLARAGVAGVMVRTGDGWLGAPDLAPFDRVEATVGVGDLAPAWVAQLTPAGVVVVPLALHPGVQVSVAFTRDGQRLRSRSVQRCGFIPLRGPHAGPATFTALRPDLLVRLHADGGGDTLALVGRLLDTTPTREPAPRLPDGWFARLALAAPGAIQLHPANAQTLQEVTCGLLDLAAPGLALVLEQACELVGFGDRAPLDRLRAHLATSPPLDLRTVRVEAVPVTATRPTPPPAGWVLARSAHQFRIQEP